jgi:hypothetical protein
MANVKHAMLKSGGCAMNQPHQFETFEAAELFCPRCRQARPVRKHLLLILPSGNKYDYRCAVCATSVGSKMDDDNRDFSLLKGS